ncbi:MAG: NADPH:quinone oxidoreductase family protein, partial [Burkholderiales bacterium]
MRGWQAAMHGGPEALAVAELDRPRAAPGEVVVEVDAAALNFSDLLMVRGTYQVAPPVPFVPGQEIAGVVAETAAESAFKVGERVATKVPWGGFAEYALAREDMLIRCPATIALTDAATLPVVWPTAWIALHECARLRQGETVLVHAAAGGVGLAAVQLARLAGARAIALVGDPEKAAPCREAGAETVLGYADAGWPERVKELTGGRGAEVVLDSVGGEATDASLRCLARHGRLLVVGFSSGKISELRANRLLLRAASAHGVYWSHDHDRPLVERALRELLRLAARGEIRPAAHRLYPFEELPQA